MKHFRQLATASLVVLAIGAASAQSLGDYARTVRKNKVEPTTASRSFDNDNLPTNQPLNMIGPTPTDDVSRANGARATASSPDQAAADRQKGADEWKTKVAQQQEKVDALNKEIEKEQNDSRLRAAVVYSDTANRLRNAAEWGKQDTDSKSSLDEKQKALDAARQELDQMQENARKAGVQQADKDKGNK